MNAHRLDPTAREVYVPDLGPQSTELVPVTRAGRPASARSASISGNGRFVVFRREDGEWRVAHRHADTVTE